MTIENAPHPVPLTSRQLDDELRVLESAVSVSGMSVSGAVARAFMLGLDQGKATVLAAANELLEPQVAMSRAFALGRAVLAIMAWTELVEGRAFNGFRAPGSVSVMAGDGESVDGIFSFHFEHGSDQHEALCKLATWCTEHPTLPALLASSPATEPAPAPSATEESSEF